MLDLKRYLSPSEAARRLGVSGQQVRHLARTGQIPSLETANGRLFDEGDVAALAAERQQRAATRREASGATGGH